MNRRYIGLDFETANFEQTSACSVGIVELEDRQIIRRKYWLIRPPTSYFKPEFIEIHGLCWRDVEKAPVFAEVWRELAHYLNHSIIFAHNAGFDMAVLRALIKHYHLRYENITYFDTLQLSRAAWRDLKCHKLGYLADYMNLSFRHHNALADAQMCANILLKIAEDDHLSVYDVVQKYALKIRVL